MVLCRVYLSYRNYLRVFYYLFLRKNHHLVHTVCADNDRLEYSYSHNRLLDSKKATDFQHTVQVVKSFFFFFSVEQLYRKSLRKCETATLKPANRILPARYRELRFENCHCVCRTWSENRFSKNTLLRRYVNYAINFLEIQGHQERD